MERLIDDRVKQKLLDSLAKEPTMVLSTAYAYAKNYVKYGEDITKEWTTAVQQASIIEKVSLNAWAQAHETFRREYETRLKADMVAMLTEIQLGMEEKVDNRDFMVKRIQEIIESPELRPDDDFQDGYNTCLADICKSIQEKINELKGE